MSLEDILDNYIFILIYKSQPNLSRKSMDILVKEVESLPERSNYVRVETRQQESGLSL